MNPNLFKSTYKNITMFILVTFFVVSFFGASYGMEMRKDGKMSDCLFFTGTAICNMNVAEHISAWQSMFISLPFKNISLITFILLTVIFALFFLRNFLNIINPRLTLLHNQHFRENTFLIHNKLKEAFSNGILNPKLF